MPSKSKSSQESGPSLINNVAGNLGFGLLGVNPLAFEPTKDNPFGSFFAGASPSFNPTFASGSGPVASAQPTSLFGSTPQSGGGARNFTLADAISGGLDAGRNPLVSRGNPSSGIGTSVQVQPRITQSPLAGGGFSIDNDRFFNSGSSLQNFGGTNIPTFGAINNIAGRNFFNDLQGNVDNNSVGSIFGGALDNLFVDPSSVISSASSSRGGGGIGSLPGRTTTPLISGAQGQQAIDTLLNPDSLFDVISGGPIVDRINEANARLLGAVETNSNRQLEDNLDRATSNAAANNLFSSGELLKQRSRITEDNLNNLAQTSAQLESNALRDLINAANLDIGFQQGGADSVLGAASVDKQIQGSFDNARIGAAAQLQQAQQELALRAALANQGNALGLLQLGQQGFQNTTGNLLGASTKPLELITSLATGFPGLSSGSSSSKSI